VLAGMGRCGAPCEGAMTREHYAQTADAARALLSGDPQPVLAAAQRRMASLSAQERFEEAAAHRDRAGAFVRAVDRMQRLSGLAACPQVVAARPGFGGGWELAVVRFGRLAGASTVPVGAAPAPYIQALVATAETVIPRPGPHGLHPLGAATAEEVGQILSWLAEPGARLIALDGEWTSPVEGAGRLRHWLDAAEEGRAAAQPFDDRRGLRPVHRPVRAAI